MPRKARLEFPGAVYHVRDHGDRCEAAFARHADPTPTSSSWLNQVERWFAKI